MSTMPTRMLIRQPNSQLWALLYQRWATWWVNWKSRWNSRKRWNSRNSSIWPIRQF